MRSFELPEEVVKAAKKLDYELYKALLFEYGKRGEKAFFYLREGRVKKYKDFFVVVGEYEYIVDDNFCSCRDFQFNLKAKMPCAHIIAVKTAKLMHCYDEYDEYYVDYMVEG
jgi:predicted nucleic acid-binding Zn finger protein